MITVPLRSRRRKRARAAQKFQHVVPAFPLLIAGIEGLRGGHEGWRFLLALFEIGTSALLIGTMLRDIRSLRRPHGDAHDTHAAHGVDWFDVFASGVLAAEAIEHWYETHHWRRPLILTAVVTLALGLLHGRLEAWGEGKRALKVSDEGISVGRRPFGLFRATWAEVTAIDVDDRVATIRTRDGREQRIDLEDCEHPAPVRAALADAQSRLPQATGNG